MRDIAYLKHSPYRRLMKYTFPILLFLISFNLSGCDNDTAQRVLDEYVKRMGNVLQTKIELIQPNVSSGLVKFPEKRERTIKTVELRQGFWEVLDFRQCDMLSIISERNSLLGKVMLPSQKMRYELRFFDALKTCKALVAAIPDPDDSQLAFKLRLDEIYQLKAANLPAEIWNGIYASDEISKHFKTGAQPLLLKQSPEQSNHERIQLALERLTYLSSLSKRETSELPNWLDNIEDEYAVFHHSDFGSQLLATLPLLTTTLNKVASAIETRLKRKAFCYKGHQPQRATVLSNVFRKYYVAQVQPYMAILEQQGKPWVEAHDVIMTKLPTPTQVQQYQQQVLSLQNPDSLWNQWVAARNRHTKAWQTILGQCNMMPSV